jgi:hypothetical protein
MRGEQKLEACASLRYWQLLVFWRVFGLEEFVLFSL